MQWASDSISALRCIRASLAEVVVKFVQRAGERPRIFNDQKIEQRRFANGGSAPSM
jgi:hypothetical protein